MRDFLQLLVSGVAVGSIYALAALGFVLIYKSSRVINFAHGQFIAIGAFAAYALATWARLPFWLAALLAILVTAGLGFAVERVFLKRMVGQPIISVIMVTIGLASVLDGLMYLTPFGSGNFSYPPFLPSGGISLGGVSLPYTQLLAIGFAAAFLLLFTWFFQRSILGVSMRAVADDQMASMSLGVSVERVFALAWAVAGLTAAAAGIVVGTVSGLNQGGLIGIGLAVFPAAILGGLDSVPGAVVGGVVIGVLQQLAAGYLNRFVPGGGTEYVLPFVVLLVMLWFRPYGLFGLEEIERV
ncbi:MULTISPECIES: branched-chain amino acid ABC transporter permease [unclassified Meiothermus]|uniref:branched-chain amino acid ABC transporter permease n=1 Tax=unclassified Meiothermus TaxID=370471 RepID=UPI000D7B94BF|nr:MULTISPECIES: branched-chain amino acid ABC transporter permease [unclassified Meiothermus]PZA06453.1 branched-chain amino acid ABC transporter permease [Meiothermus sp. Pnk-1]RYM36280.1 branched-chain amino acid ABC transporter permease [Meiothermus sp. PNK-Is4]